MTIKIRCHVRRQAVLVMWPSCVHVPVMPYPARSCCAGAAQADGQGEASSESGDSLASDDEDDDAIEMVCDFRKFSLTTEQPASGWAIAPLQHLL